MPVLVVQNSAEIAHEFVLTAPRFQASLSAGTGQLQIDDPGAEHALHERIPVGLLQSGAREHGSATRIPTARQPAEQLEPGPTVDVVERSISRHFGSILARMEGICVLKCEPQALGQEGANGRLSTTAHTHHDDEHRSSRSERRARGQCSSARLMACMLYLLDEPS